MFIDLLLVLVVCIKSCYAIIGPVCLDCQGISRPSDCNVVTKCGIHEVCLIEEYVTNDGIVLFNLGCKDSVMCKLSTANSFGRRQEDTINLDKRTDTVVCSTCCDSKNICNREGCGKPPPSLPTGSTICYKCDASANPDQCTKITLCNKDQSCSITKEANRLGQSRWKHDCTNKQLCAFPTSSNCSYCCDSELCNDNCNPQTTNNSPVITTTSQQTTTHSTTHTTILQKTTTQRPSTTTHQPSTTTNQPSTTTNQPSTTTHRPSTTTHRPSTTTHRPTTTNHRPSTTPIPTTTAQIQTTQRTTLLPLSSPIIVQVDKQPQYIHYGDTVILSCSAIGNPKPSYSFKFRDGPLPSNAKVKDNTLTLSNFMPHNIGNYECIASNSEGSGYYGLLLKA